MLPSGSECPGDTATGGYHVYSYLIQAGSDISGATFVNAPSSGYGFVDNTGTYYGPANTAINSGDIISIPTNFQWAPVVTVLGLPLSTLLYSGSSGAWDGGLVCTNTTGHVVSAWNTRIKFIASSSDPNGFTWTAIPGVALPGAPTQANASAGTGGATVTWAAPANDSGLPITGYVITPFLNGVAEPPKTYNSTALKEVVSGLQKGKNYTFEVAAVNGLGTGPKSAMSNSVSPK